MPTLSSFMTAAKHQATDRLELLILLSLLAGLLTGIFYRPAIDVIDAVMAAASVPNPSEEDYMHAAELLTAGLGALIMGQLALIMVSAFLLPIWARATAPSGLIPGEGGVSAFFHRGFQAAKHLLIAMGMTISSLALIAPIAAVLSQLLGSLAVALGGILFLWLNFVWSATANVAIMLTADQPPITFRAAWSYARIFLRPIAGAYAAFWLIAGVINLLLGNMITQSLPADWAKPLSLVLSGALTYAAAALHLGSLFSLPGKTGTTEDTED